MKVFDLGEKGVAIGWETLGDLESTVENLESYTGDPGDPPFVYGEFDIEGCEGTDEMDDLIQSIGEGMEEDE